jgi:hypothetical protein
MGRSAFHQTCKKCGVVGHREKTCTFTPKLKASLTKLFNECNKPGDIPIENIMWSDEERDRFMKGMSK